MNLQETPSERVTSHDSDARMISRVFFQVVNVVPLKTHFSRVLFGGKNFLPV